MGGAAVFPLVGLNESGKTTVLEAIHSFSPDKATSELLGGEEGTGVPFKERVPRHLISLFTGYVTVTATLAVDDDDVNAISSAILKSHGLEIAPGSFPSEVVLDRQQQFRGGDFVGSFFTLRTQLSVKEPKKRKWRPMTATESAAVRMTIYGYTPDIAYFPTFVFNFPASIYLTDRGGIIDRFYRQVFQDILDCDGRGHTIEKDITRRVRTDDYIAPWLNFLNLWSQSDDRDKIQNVMDRAGAVATKVVFGRWNKIFGEDTRGKEVIITYEIVEGEKPNATGAKIKTQEHDVVVKFKIKDGTRRFDVNDRSLGFRWFFAFMIFTQFRVARSSTRPIVFLFDEPASNLHAAAQQKLVDSFPEIGKGKHTLIYTTHSHYMIDPRWLEQTFIVTNRADAPPSSVLDEISLDDESLDVRVSTYRSFVNDHPTQTSYFQPVLDRLEVVPSRFDLRNKSVVVEGKSDYYMLRYAAAAAGVKGLPIMPGLGAGTLGALVAMNVGWNLDLLFILDCDRQGKVERARYIRDFGVPPASVATLDEFDASVAVIEDLLDGEAREVVRDQLGLDDIPSKAQIHRFIQERLASNQIIPLSKAFVSKSSVLLKAMKSRLRL